MMQIIYAAAAQSIYFLLSQNPPVTLQHLHNASFHVIDAVRLKTSVKESNEENKGEK
jgi:hypothetical protein